MNNIARKTIATVALAGSLLLGAGAQPAAAAGYEDTLTASWGKVEHTAKGSIGSLKLNVKLHDLHKDHCVYVKGQINTNNGPDYTRDVGKVCGKGKSKTFSYTFKPVAATSITGVTVILCQEDRFRDTCIKEFNRR